MSLTVNQYYLCDPEKLDRIIRNQEKIMSEITDLKASVAELKKDSERMISVLGQTRQALTDAQASIDDLKKNTHLSDEDRAALDETKQMLADADAAIENQVPEAPAPTEPPAEPAPAV